MELGLLKELFKGGILSNATVRQHEKRNTAWIVEIHRTNGAIDQITLSMSGRSGEQKLYRRLTAALMDIGRIGFQEATVFLPSGLIDAPSVFKAGLK